MMNIRRPVHSSESGYSLTEMLVVVAIIGVLSLVAVPNFMSMYRSNRLKTSLRQFANDLRASRQLAVTNSSIVRVAFENNSRNYYIFESRDEGATWTEVGSQTPRILQEGTYLRNDTGASKWTDTIDDGTLGDLPDIVFERTGIAQVPAGIGKLTIGSDFKDLPKSSFTVSVRTTGIVQSE